MFTVARHRSQTKLDVNVGEKTGQVGKVAKYLYSENYGQQAGGNIPKRERPRFGVSRSKKRLYDRDLQLIYCVIRIVHVPTALLLS